VDSDEDTCSNPDTGSQSERSNPTTFRTTLCGSHHGGASEPSNPNLIKSSASSKSGNLFLLTSIFLSVRSYSVFNTFPASLFGHWR